ncbi:hypothetical protein [Streptomyces sp. NPDC006335]|uniref:hypothetical protein n=1 Tax=Streptomyces sp. NPDC006335 TaxID=3156895 RepID=UPI0033BD702F
MSAAEGTAPRETSGDLDLGNLACAWELTRAVLLPWTGAAGHAPTPKPVTGERAAE